ncbi:hypothetical protein UPTC5098_00699 [Campylobacter lari]
MIMAYLNLLCKTQLLHTAHLRTALAHAKEGTIFLLVKILITLHLGRLYVFFVYSIIFL